MFLEMALRRTSLRVSISFLNYTNVINSIIFINVLIIVDKKQPISFGLTN
ncbi:hypothetical protein SAMN05421638_0248 [Kaistella treverensis]|uniref:Uncharacterized protein n=1 Tax=Kaistella treverensis TaxID=631455 RepID=A0A1I3JL86_9FLAO|nr:hypothetical protein SAMN05421638_0248 [Kaistella treverensis]